MIRKPGHQHTPRRVGCSDTGLARVFLQQRAGKQAGQELCERLQESDRLVPGSSTVCESDLAAAPWETQFDFSSTGSLCEDRRIANTGGSGFHDIGVARGGFVCAPPFLGSVAALVSPALSYLSSAEQPGFFFRF